MDFKSKKYRVKTEEKEFETLEEAEEYVEDCVEVIDLEEELYQIIEDDERICNKREFLREFIEYENHWQRSYADIERVLTGLSKVKIIDFKRFMNAYSGFFYKYGGVYRNLVQSKIGERVIIKNKDTYIRCEKEGTEWWYSLSGKCRDSADLAEEAEHKPSNITYLDGKNAPVIREVDGNLLLNLEVATSWDANICPKDKEVRPFVKGNRQITISITA